MHYHAPDYLTWQQPDIRPFKWGTTGPCISRGCKTAVRQSWQSKKKADILGSRLLFSRFCLVIAGLREARVRYPAGRTLTARSFAVHLSSSYVLKLQVFGRPGFDTRPGRTLRASRFTALWATKTYSTFLETSDVPHLWAKRTRAWQHF